MIKIPLPFGKKKKGPAKIRKRSRKPLGKKLSKQTWILISVLPIFLILIRLLATKVIANPANIIQSVVIDEESNLVYASDEIQQSLSEYFSGMNYRTYSYTKQGEFSTMIKDEFPIIQDILISQTQQKDQILAQIEYATPDLTLSHKSSTWVAHENVSYKVNAADSIKEGLLELRLPNTIEEIGTLEGIFHHIHSDTLVKVINNITDIIDAKDITDIEYLPGGKKLHISYKDKLILFHLDKSIDAQLAKLLDLKQFYSDFDTVTRLDLGSNNDIIVK